MFDNLVGGPLGMSPGGAVGGMWDMATGGGAHMPFDPGNFVNAYSGKYGADKAYQGQDEANKMQYRMFNEGNAFSAKQSRIQRQFEADEVRVGRRWQERMSNSAVQRKMADMKKAGINPILAAGGSGTGAASGASMPPGSAARGSSAKSVQPPKMGNPGAGYLGLANALQGAVATALQAKDVISKVELRSADIDKVKEITDLTSELKGKEMYNKQIARLERNMKQIDHNIKIGNSTIVRDKVVEEMKADIQSAKTLAKQKGYDEDVALLDAILNRVLKLRK